jgi:hypothetical protein
MYLRNSPSLVIELMNRNYISIIGGGVSGFFLKLVKFRQWEKLKIKKSKINWFWSFLIATSEKIKNSSKNHQIFILGFFKCVTKIYKDDIHLIFGL